MTRLKTLTRVLAFAAFGVVLVGCASTRVTRDAPTRQMVSTPKHGASTLVQRGDTLYRIAINNGITLRDLAAWNSIPAPYTIYPGQRLVLYPRAGVSRNMAVVPRSPPARSRPASPAPVATTRVASNIEWRWPADGQLISRFQAGEPTKQGIDISGTSGAPVRASGDGVVVYSGSGLVGYGELIIVKHDEQWLSAYGHNRNRLVNEGQLVKSGQQIAELGRTGASRDMLHFEIRHNGKPVDPLLYLPKR